MEVLISFDVFPSIYIQDMTAESSPACLVILFLKIAHCCLVKNMSISAGNVLL